MAEPEPVTRRERPPSQPDLLRPRRPPVEPPRAGPSALRRFAEALIPYGLLVAVAGVVLVALWLRLGDGPVEWKYRFLLFALSAPVVQGVLHFELDRLRAPTMRFSRAADLAASARTLSRHLFHLPRALRVVAVALVIAALARPQHPSAELSEVEGIDIVIALDVSDSMGEQDLRPNRLEAAKRVIKKFVAPRDSDRIGLVIFGREAFTQCPLTLDHRALGGLLDDVRLQLIDGRGTAIGNALGTALNRLRKSDAKSKVIILLTDGDNNAGNLAPEQAARYAQTLGVKVFTILMGRDADIDAATDPTGGLMGGGLRPAVRYPVNPKLLEEIASLTGGTPYLATDTSTLEKRFQAILDELDKTHIKDQKGKPTELFGVFIELALALLLLEFVLAMTRLRRFP
jgi:Ca-activated chloride channel family protein